MVVSTPGILRALLTTISSLANLMNVYDILKAKYLVLDKEALAVIEEVFA